LTSDQQGYKMKKASEEIKSEYLEIHLEDEEDNEFERYKTSIQHNRDECTNPVEWWGRRKSELPNMAELAKKYLAIP
ncbi:4011_t:CDS:1, partial [Acaulospora colombiana]